MDRTGMIGFCFQTHSTLQIFYGITLKTATVDIQMTTVSIARMNLTLISNGLMHNMNRYARNSESMPVSKKRRIPPENRAASAVAEDWSADPPRKRALYPRSFVPLQKPIRIDYL
jgi:hypothetical protein